MAYTFLTPEKAWENLDNYRNMYYRKNIAAYSGETSDLVATSEKDMFWGRQSGKCKMHVPIGADIAATSANLLFGEEPAFTCYDVSTEDNENEQQKRLDYLVERNNMHGKLNEAAESCAALGDVYLKLNWWKDEIDYPVLNVVSGDSAWPEFLFGVLKGIHFFSVVSRDLQTGKVTRAYELYEKGKITSAIYLGDATSLGQEQGEGALAEYGLKRETKVPIDDMLAVHIPNMKPNRVYRDSFMGRSDFDGLRGLMDELDETYTSWMRDVRLAKARTIIPAEYLKRDTKEMLQGNSKALSWDFDTDVETFVALDMHDENGNIPSITMQQFAIRSEEHMATCNELMTKIVSIAGYAPQTFGMDIVGMAQSGTALHIREKKSYDTRGKKETYWKSTLQDIMTAMIHLDNALWPESGSDADDQVKVRFADSFANDISTMANAVSLLNAANAASTEVKVRMLHPDWTQKQIADEVKRLKTPEHLLLYNSQLMTKEQFLRYYYADDETEMKQAISEIEEQDSRQEEQEDEDIRLEENNRKHVQQNVEEEYSSDNQQTVTGNTTAGR